MSRETQDAPSSLLMAASQVLAQGRALLAELDAETYRRKAAPDRSSIGDHYRHILDHFSCLMEGLPAHAVNYDARQRDTRIAEDREFAAWLTENLLQQVSSLEGAGNAMLGEAIEVTYSVGYGNREPDSMMSTVGREVAFSVSHAVHHYAIVRLLAESFGASLPADFGVAPSTLNHLAADEVLATR